MRSTFGAAVLVVLAVGGPRGAAPAPPALEQRIRDAEDARAPDPAQLAVIVAGLDGGPAIQRLAARAIGRLEREPLVDRLVPLLASPDAAVRAEAANAIGQAAVRGKADRAFAALAARAGVEPDPGVRGVLGRTIGRLPFDRADAVGRAEAVMLALAPAEGRPAGSAAAGGAGAARAAAAAGAQAADIAHGLEALARRRGKVARLGDAARAWLRARVLVTHPSVAPDTAPRPDAPRGRPPHAAAAPDTAPGPDAPRGRPPHAAAVPDTAPRPDARGVRLPHTSGAPGAALRPDARRDHPPHASADTAAALAARTAMRALIAAEAVDEGLVRAAEASPDAQLRRLAMSAASVVPSAGWMRAALERGTRDGSFLVRLEAFTQLTRVAGAAACPSLVAAIDDRHVHVRLRALDLAGSTCGGSRAAVDAVAARVAGALLTPPRGIAAEPPDAQPVAAPGAAGNPATAGSSAAPAGDAVAGVHTWHGPAHALVALARLAPDRARAALATAARHPVWQVRAYAARAAGAAGETAALPPLLRDPVDNVRHAAIEALDAAGRVAEAAALVAALERDDPQLLRTAAIALRGTVMRRPAVAGLAAALSRVSASRRDTSRDCRLALIDRLAELGQGDGTAIQALRPRLDDFDPQVAARAAAALSSSTGEAVVAAPRPAPRRPVPTAAERGHAARVDLLCTMRRGGRFRLRLWPEEAPTNAWRMLRLARSGYFDGLTFHRVEPGFVVQGGSPGGNEYAGDAAYTRDEVGLRSHRRGTIGISTRGRDTGDGQIFINLVDNLRLDHDYTVVGEVVDGMAVVEAILEGDAIARIDVIARTSRR